MSRRLYGVIWKWHFAIGLIACPLIVLVALSGAAYVFQPELERWLNADLMTVTPGTPRPVSEVVAAAETVCKPVALSIPGPRDRATLVYCDGWEREVYVDPHTARVLGSRDSEGTLFRVIFAIHWELLLGEKGRLLVEWATSWTLLLLFSGAYLWWPRGKRKVAGVWTWRNELKGRQWLRDVHAVTGAYAIPVLLALCATGLMWTVYAGDKRWNPLVAATSSSKAAHVERTPGPATQPVVSVDVALAGAKVDLQTEWRSVFINLPEREPKDNATYGFYVSDGTHVRPSLTENITVDAFTGIEREREGWAGRSVLGKIDAARYSIHIGAFLALPGRIAACLAALVLAAMCITGPWLWWKRRPKGKLGVPPAGRAPWPIYVMLVVFGWLLPTVGYTLLAAVAIELVALAIARVRR